MAIDNMHKWWNLDTWFCRVGGCIINFNFHS